MSVDKEAMWDALGRLVLGDAPNERDSKEWARFRAEVENEENILPLLLGMNRCNAFRIREALEEGRLLDDFIADIRLFNRYGWH